MRCIGRLLTSGSRPDIHHIIMTHTDGCEVTFSSYSLATLVLGMEGLICCVTFQAFLRTLVEFCDDPVEKRRLQELCSKQGAGDYTKYIREPTLCLQDILAAFPSCSPPIEVVLGTADVLVAFPSCSPPIEVVLGTADVLVVFPSCSPPIEVVLGTADVLVVFPSCSPPIEVVLGTADVLVVFPSCSPPIEVVLGTADVLVVFPSCSPPIEVVNLNLNVVRSQHWR